MATETQIGNGFRRNMTTFGSRNFEDSGTVQYASNRPNLWFMGSYYNKGVTLTFDVGGTSYSKAAIHYLRLYWDNRWILPLT
jgi:hypothetical protein